MSGRFRMRQCTFGQTIHTVSNGFLFFDVFGSPDEAQRVCDRLNELIEENEQLKQQLESEHTMLDNAILLERTRMGQNSLKQYKEAIQ